MNEQEKQAYLEKYKKAKEKGVSFFPDILFKDSIAALLVFLIILALAYFIGVPLEERANPADADYTPRPEWYFLFLFQLLKYFPGELEVIGVVVLPTLAIILLFLLPFLDKGANRYFLSRPWTTGVTTLVVIGIIGLTIQSVREQPPPVEAGEGDETAALYSENCAGCHGPSINVPVGTNLHEVITEGGHEGMPAWSADLTSDEVDSLAGFILSPGGSQLFTEECGECHGATELVSNEPVTLKNALELGVGFPQHSEVDITDWKVTLSREERTAILNFLVAPDGRRLFVTNCSSCHGRSVAYTGEAEELRELIAEGGLHLEMPPWRERLSGEAIINLTNFIINPSSSGAGAQLYEENCTRCHGDRVPAGGEFEETRQLIAFGGSHETMPVWGDLLTNEQLDALVQYTLEAASGAPQALGQQLFADNCSDCHGDLGEGGENPARPGDIIAPISTAEYLKTRDDSTLRAIIAQGQPNFGMSPFGSAFGGPLDNDEIDALVGYLRSWQADPPVELPPEITVETVDLNGFEIFSEVCAQCHGITGGGDTGPSLRDPDFRNNRTNQQMYDSISQGHEASDMIAWGSILSSGQIEQLVDFINQLPIDPESVTVEGDTGEAADEVEPEPTPEVITFSGTIAPTLEFWCVDCHGSDGGWDSSTYDLFMNSGDHAPVVIPGDPDNSLLVQKLIGAQEDGKQMPPPPLRPLNEDLIQLFIDWIAAGALNN